MTLRSKNKITAIKLEATYGTYSGPDGTMAMKTSDLEVTPMDGSTIEMEVDRNSFGANEKFHTDIHSSTAFNFHLAGSDSATVIPAWGAVMRSCGFGETQDATPGQEKTIYSPASDGHDSYSQLFEKDNNLHKLTGLRGNITFDFTKGQLPKASFNGKGLYIIAENNVTPITPDLSAWKKPLIVNRENTPTILLHGNAVVMESLTIDCGVEVQFDSKPGSSSDSVRIVGRKITGSIVIECPDVATIDYFELAKNNTFGAFQFIHGTVAGKIVELGGANAQISNPKYGDSNGIVTLSLDLSFVPISGDDEFYLHCK